MCAAKRALSEVAGTFSVPFGSPKGTPQKQDAVESSEAPHGGAQRKRKPKEKKEQFIVFLPRLWYTYLVCTRKSVLKFVTGVSLFWEETPYEVSLLRRAGVFARAPQPRAACYAGPRRAGRRAHPPYPLHQARPRYAVCGHFERPGYSAAQPQLGHSADQPDRGAAAPLGD